ncbi:hypothetical protein [Paludisphaera mucosa]|uniref:Uncharacterized protein n=1 Tax=Paludisphaera mucosa TaxID=3030827 RepID=A0ABT6FDD8_9BACT|nr:hypothetical protein [Paludisphaera mucosa]MDG3005586.1 hypothetical protein [Paludisphaera mucosa]
MKHPNVGRTAASSPKFLRRLVLGAILLFGFASIFYQFVPNFTPVPYSPWFLDRVEEGVVSTLELAGDGISAVGILSEPREYRPTSKDMPPAFVTRYSVVFPTQAAVQPVVDRLLAGSEEAGARVVIVRRPAPPRAVPALLFCFAVPTSFVLGAWYGMTRLRRPQATPPTESTEGPSGPPTP